VIDLKFIQKNPELVKENTKNRNMQADVDQVIELARKRSLIIQEVDEIRRAQNETAAAMKSKLSPEEREELISKGSALKASLGDHEKALKEIEPLLKEEQSRIPNLTHPDAPGGEGEESNKELRVVGQIPQFDFAPKDHVELGKNLNILDFEGGTKVSGPKFFFLKGDGLWLEQALINYALKILTREGFTPHGTPDMAKAGILFGTGFNPRGDETQIYSINGTDLCMIATAEITLAGLMSDEILKVDDLPMKLAGLSHCFRTEAGTYGKAMKGLYRVHQFTKVEMFAFTTPEQSDDMLDQLVRIEEGIFTGLGIPYRVVECCTGDLGAAAYRKYDLEAWMPGRGEQGSFGEVTSASNCSDYQARRLNVRYRPKGSKNVALVHTLNGTAVATSRALLAIIENHQQKDGSVKVPEVLRPFMEKDRITPP
jgi:seryl-tRNA synthetase